MSGYGPEYFDRDYFRLHPGKRRHTHRQLFGRDTLARALVAAEFERPRVSTYFNFCTVGESTPFLRPLSRIGRLVTVPWVGDLLLGVARKDSG